MADFEAENQAIAKITEALSSLESDAIQRVLNLISQRYRSKTVSQTNLDQLVLLNDQATEPIFSEFHELFDATQPVSSSERALVAGYWFQKILEKPELDGFLLNKELKNLGYPSSNITRELGSLMRKIPRLVTQIRKEGTSQQARKTYKLTREGIRAVEKMLAANRSSANVESDAV